MRRWRNLIIIAGVFLSVCALSTAVASYAQSGLPGDNTYPIKLTLERLRYTIAGTDVARARLRMEFLGNRLNELDQVSGPQNASLAVKELDAALEDAAKAVAAVPASRVGDLRAQLSGLALQAADLSKHPQMAGDDGPETDHLVKLASAIGQAAADPNASASSLLLLLDQAPVDTTASDDPVTITARSVDVPADLAAEHKPPFSGKHAQIDCNRCHVGGKTEGLPSACSACHDDVHENKFQPAGYDCDSCHNDVAFKPATFDHAKFPDCRACHTVDGPQNHYPGQCSNCHTTDAWKLARFDHTGFTDCQSCHSDRTPDNHYEGQCSACHSTSAWKPSTFDHARFPDCQSCHNVNAPQDHYPGQCSNCHTTDAWKPSTFDHARFPDCQSCHNVDAPQNHYAGQCSNCHTTGAWKPAKFNHNGFTDCANCHSKVKPSDHYPGQCSACHTTDAWKPAHFNHEGFTDCASCHANTKPQNHYPGQCSNCHNTTAFKPASMNHTGLTDCQSCHASTRPANHYPGQCSNCHNTTAFKPVNFSHSGLTDCQSCHASTRPANHVAGQCSNCHTPTTWSAIKFNHAFPLNHGGANQQCTICHPLGNTAAWACTNCHQLSQITSIHRSVRGYNGVCVACHANGSVPEH